MFGSIGVAAVTYYTTSDRVEYTSINPDWKVSDVKQALDELYNLSNNIFDTEYENISDSVSIPVVSGNSNAGLYRLNNTVYLRLSATVATIINTSYTYIGKITNSKYFPLTDVIDNGIGAGNGFVRIKVASDGKIYAFNSITNGGWITVDMNWIINQ